MDDFTLLKDMADRTPLPTSTDLAPARARLTAAFTQKDEQSTEPARLTAGKPRRRRRLVVSTVAVVGLAAAITGVVALGGLEQVGVAPPKASAAEILHQAADAVRELPATPPRPDQFIYTKTQSLDRTTNPDGDPVLRESWMSADGTHDGLTIQHGERIPRPGCRDGQRAVVFASEVVPGEFEPCEPYPAYRSDLPTDAAAMRKFLEQDGGGNANQVGKNIAYYVAETYVPPESLAALFEALAGYPGLAVVEHATDSAGRPGVGVSWSAPGQGQEIIMTLVFDRETHAFLGTSDWDTIVAQGIVDAVGQQP